LIPQWPGSGFRDSQKAKITGKGWSGHTGGLASVIVLSLETPEDRWEVEALYDLCFAPGREALSSYRLRESVPPVAGLSLLARDESDQVAAAIRHWPARVSGLRVLLLGPIAVHPTRQGEGLGGFLILEGLRRAKQAGWKRVALVGDAPYYSRFGFRQLGDVEMPPPTNPERLLGLELSAGAWQGVRGKLERETGY